MTAQPTTLPVRVFAGPQAGIAAARNLGLSQARGKWIASFDDDQIASRGWLRALRERADREDAACVGGALALVFPAGAPESPPGPRVRSVLGEHAPYRFAQPYRGKYQPATNNALIRRDLFLALNGFDTRFTEGGEDKDLFLRIRNAGYAMWFEPAALADHITPASRLTMHNLRWTSLRLGASDARSAIVAGPAAAFRLAVTRVVSAVVRDLPCLLRPDPAKRMDTRCSLWYDQGLLRGLVSLCRSPSADDAFLRSLNFRARNGERPAPSSTVAPLASSFEAEQA